MITMKRDVNRLQKELRAMKDDKKAGKSTRAATPPRTAKGKGGGGGARNKPKKGDGGDLCFRFNDKGCSGIVLLGGAVSGQLIICQRCRSQAG